MLRVLFGLFLATSVLAQNEGYIGYSLTERGDPDSVLYETADTTVGGSTTYPPPDVYLNASVHVGEIDIEVLNLTAQIDLSAQVLSLLTFNAGVDASINRVALSITNITAKVVLEARLGNLVTMIGDVLNSLDLNPALATLGQVVTNVTNTLTGSTTSSASGSGSTSLSKRDPLSYNLAHGVLYSVNDYSGDAHTNRILTQTGSIVDHSLDNFGNIISEKVSGSYKDMQFNGYNKTVMRMGVEVQELEYIYQPFPGLSIITAVFVDANGDVVGTQVLAEARGGGTSTIAEDE